MQSNSFRSLKPALALLVSAVVAFGGGSALAAESSDASTSSGGHHYPGSAKDHFKVGVKAIKPLTVDAGDKLWFGKMMANETKTKKKRIKVTGAGGEKVKVRFRHDKYVKNGGNKVARIKMPSHLKGDLGSNNGKRIFKPKVTLEMKSNPPQGKAYGKVMVRASYNH